MHIIGIILAVLAGGAVWWWRLKMMGEAANEIGDVAGRAYGKYKRNKFRKKVESSPIESVKDPVAAAVVMMLSVGGDEEKLMPETEELVRQLVVSELKVADPTELMIFGKWVAGHVADPVQVASSYSKLWTENLNDAERLQFLDMVNQVAGKAGINSARQRSIMSRLRQRLGLQTN